MISLGKRKAALRAWGQKVPLKALPHVQPVFLLQMLIGLSQVLNGGAHPEVLASALILDGQQRLRKLCKIAPHLDLSLQCLLSRIRPPEMVEEQLSDEESAFQAVLEMCLGLLLRWLSRVGDRFCPRVSSFAASRSLPFDVLPLSHSSVHLLLFRARSCLIS